ncbi:hypothetical protein H3V53_05575 [Paraburkholderia bengalensis]|uniref:DUF4148 domain-containing protein n=1 Tax=Paraburkholderia bengalensis TaxID=2747562 RepID=A0ABU8IMC5_9BURK
MKVKIIAFLLAASSAALATPAFASGYGPAPWYRPDVGAPASQSGQVAQASYMQESHVNMASESAASFGDDEMAHTESGHRAMAVLDEPLDR